MFITFRVIKLQNGLTALLISDVESKGCASQDDDKDKGKHYMWIILQVLYKK